MAHDINCVFYKIKCNLNYIEFTPMSHFSTIYNNNNTYIQYTYILQYPLFNA